MASTPSYTRRRFLRETFAFSALAAIGRHARADAPLPDLDASAQHLLMIGDWGKFKDEERQHRVAAAMRRYVLQHQLKLDAVLLLGDNFYGRFEGGVHCPRWKSQFEETYPAAIFDCPFYAVLGNHDYRIEPAGKWQAQLDYSAGGHTRWRMPAKWYDFTLRRSPALASFLAVDTNFPSANKENQTLSASEQAAQQHWLSEQLGSPRATPYTIVLGHHPLYSNGKHGDTSALVRDWDALLRTSRAHLYVCGHDHDLQHLEFAGHPTSFVVSGGGGAELTEIKRDPATRGPYSQSAEGFTHLQLNSEALTLRHLGSDGNVLHAFRKSPHGLVTILN